MKSLLFLGLILSAFSSAFSQNLDSLMLDKPNLRIYKILEGDTTITTVQCATAAEVTALNNATPTALQQFNDKQIFETNEALFLSTSRVEVNGKEHAFFISYMDAYDEENQDAKREVYTVKVLGYKNDEFNSFEQHVEILTDGCPSPQPSGN